MANGSASAHPLAPNPVLDPGHNFNSIGDKINAVVLTPKFRPGWVLGLLISFGLLNVLLVSVAWTIFRGVGVWGINIPVGWGFAIVNFVWWIGIGHAGTLISAILLLLNQKWRNSINRFAEAMTLFAVACAGLFPLLHMGRPWFFYWMMPIPLPQALLPQFRSPLVWDVFAVSTYATVSALFWLVGLIPDFATLRDKAVNPIVKRLFGVLSLGWRGAASHWHNYEMTYLLLAGLSTPLVVSVHTVVSFDFSVGVIPGWHATIFPPYFVAGAIYSGFAMVLTLAIPTRAAYNMKDFITDRHLDNMAKIMLATSLMVSYGYGSEVFFAWYSASNWEKYMMFDNRMSGPYMFFYWSLIFCNFIVPQLLWSKKVRTNTVILFIISIIVNIGMWLERFIIVVTSLSRDFLPSSWGMYYPTVWDFGVYFGTIGLFLTLMFLFVRFVPIMSAFEMKLLLPESKVKGGHH
ncbi:MAG: polysulfide reductase NrfD [Candidatus Sumerlaeaceae bacterium]|nr:polysulfide reductase NrfD [Candidatus Sumerlaeaceae bacterium]